MCERVCTSACSWVRERFKYNEKDFKSSFYVAGVGAAAEEQGRRRLLSGEKERERESPKKSMCVCVEESGREER